jgi:hypothetical protein
MSAPDSVDNSGIPQQSSKNLNTILLWCVCAMLGAVGVTTFTGAINLAYLRGSMVSRQEVEAKIAETNAHIIAVDKDLTALKLSLAEHGLKEHQAQR